MLRLHREVVAATEVELAGSSRAGSPTGGDVVHGQRAFEAIARQLESTVRALDILRPPNSDVAETDLERWVSAYAQVYEAFAAQLGHYFRSLYVITKFVDDSGFDEELRRTYTRILRAQLSVTEQVLLLFNGCVGPGQRKFLPLMERYDFFDNTPIEPWYEWLMSALRQHGATGIRALGPTD